MRGIFVIIFILGALFTGYLLGNGSSQISPRLFSHREFPITSKKTFVVVVYSYKQSKWCETALRSIFEQDYVPFRVVFFDDGSEDGTFEKVQSFVLANKEEERVILIKNLEKMGPSGCLYRLSKTLTEEEIVIFLNAKDWIAHPKTLSRLNEVYQNPNIWMALSHPILFPSYERVKQETLSNMCVSFYAALFKQIEFEDLWQEGRFIRGKEGFLKPMLEMANGRVRILDEPLFIANESVSRIECRDLPFHMYEALSHFPGAL